MTSPPLRSEIAAEMSLEPIRYARVWEDHAILEEALAIGPDDDVLSICSGGDNALALLLRGPRSVTAIDMSASQTALLALKVAGIRTLDHPTYAAFLGARPSTDRVATYERTVRAALDDGPRAYWDAHLDTLAAGVLDAGRLGRYFAGFQRDHLARLCDPAAVQRLLDAEDRAAQAEAFEAAFGSEAFADCFRWYYGEEMLAAGGRDPAQFAHVDEGDVGQRFLDRFRWACTELPVRGNFYLEAFLTGGCRDLEAGPPYLTPGGFARLAGGLVDRLTVVTDELERLISTSPDGAFSKANLSDIFEYASDALTEQLLRALATRMRTGGRLAYWNLLVPRSRPDTLASLLRPHRELARRLWERDRSWFYRDFVVEEVTRP